MSKLPKRILLSSFLIIFFLLIGSVCAAENVTEDSLSQDDLDINTDAELIYHENLDSTASEIVDNSFDIDLKSNYDSEFSYIGEPIQNSNFEEGKLNSNGNVQGWNVTRGGAHNSWDEASGSIVSFQGSNVLMLETGADYGYKISQYINFDNIDKISFKYTLNFPENMVNLLINNPNYQSSFIVPINVTVDNVNVMSFNTAIKVGWDEITIDTREFSGILLFQIFVTKNIPGNPGKLYFDNFTSTLNDKVKSDFTFVSNLIDDNVSVEFTNKAIGKISNIFWDFGDGTNSSEINPTHIFKPGNHKVTLTVSNENNTDSYSYDLSLNYPTINGQMYSTVQDAIDHAEANAMIDVPSDFSESLNIKNNLTLNFNGNKLISTGSIPVITVSDDANVIINGVALSGDNNIFTVDETSKLTITDSNISDAKLQLNTGDIELNDVSLNNSYLTIANANATLSNVNVANGGIVVNGGKSKITNSNLTGSNVAISQTAGELEITNNIIKDNVKGIEITGGNATITFNAIYNNTNAFNSTNANVISKNNWYGTKTVTGTDSYLTMSITTDAVKMYPGEKYTITVDLTQNNNGESTISEGSLNTFTLEFTSPNGVTTPVTINNGVGTFEFTAGAISEDVKLTLLGEEYELEDTSIVTKPIETNITITSSEKGVVVICLTTADGNVSGASVKYSINGVNSTNVTDANGQIIINGLSGKITINATFEGNETLLPSNMVNSFDFTEPTVDNKTNSTQPTVNPSKTPTSTKIVKVASKITAKKKTFKAKTKTKKYQITLKTKSGKAIKKVKVTLKVKGKTYKATTNSKGKATFKITKLTKKGKYTAVIKFAGNKNYKATSKKVKLSVKK